MGPISKADKMRMSLNKHHNNWTYILLKNCNYSWKFLAFKYVTVQFDHVIILF